MAALVPSLDHEIVRVAGQSCLGPVGRTILAMELLVEPVQVDPGTPCLLFCSRGCPQAARSSLMNACMQQGSLSPRALPPFRDSNSPYDTQLQHRRVLSISIVKFRQ